ncbi:hypothetical protein LOZ12_002640 [Ophidiomyces ophidiicola]|uniref:Uncharacterized protein n=1 Tax=Ophidiomyces ophidiicola TaxID=1387563 RepID=A0ACB8V2T2_9EURO|nr:uncharacterized protein LOZ57_006110 [Ophidiomyces ophidiicola]KAI1912682.1 hypothetical protein LOZ61_003120 [Ophidiomyces ophidiicola]KAI1918152.1 hypothetical protein LOZ64_002893 [Ophidiomyces ophidiicola]KAI1928175.1 hypothetical protein LOZ60_002489 [Ophidiomyces ophidiicola]KAI1939666.1 hypothetical protein LOZ57_006110 [Ophidiomyces ophidiicola]KAI1954638.1 hypothetical protein LOZ62_000653 [Ophidiomyces ophidiicola]
MSKIQNSRMDHFLTDTDASAFLRLKSTMDLSSLLRPDPTLSNEILSDAIRLLDSMKTSSSCHQRAVMDLVSSCQSLEDNAKSRGKDSSTHLDQFKSLYAARLAVCELDGAGAATPDSCIPILNIQHEDTILNSYNEGEKVRKVVVPAHLTSCLQSLESKPQWWTSYSNSRQNAAVMCQASRFEIERDELLKHHRDLAKITFGLSASLNQSLTDASLEALKQRNFLKILDELRLKRVNDLKTTDTLSRENFASFLKGVETQIYKAGMDAKNSMIEILSDAENILSSLDTIRDLKRSIDDIHTEAMDKDSKRIAAEQESHNANSEMALAIRSSLDEIKNHGMVHLNLEFQNFQSSLVSLNQVTASIHQKQTSLDQVPLSSVILQEYL